MRRFFRYSVRDLLWLTLVVAVVLGWFVRQRAEKIVFVWRGEGGRQNVFLGSVDGNRLNNVTKSTEFDEFDPALSPDSRRIVYVRAEELLGPKGHDLAVVNADGTGRRTLVHFGQNEIPSSPAWSPDGKRIAFASSRSLGDSSLYVVDADGRNQQKIGAGFFPSWSPDGKKLLYTEYEHGDDGDELTKICVMDADGTNQRELIKAESLMARWSPDGKRIVYLTGRFTTSTILNEKLYLNVAVANADGTNTQEFADADGMAALSVTVGPRWSADGRQIYYFSGDVGRTESDVGKTEAALSLSTITAEGKLGQNRTLRLPKITNESIPFSSFLALFIMAHS